MQVTTVAGLAADYDVSETTIRRMIKTGQLPAYRVGSGRGQLRIRVEDVGAIMRRIPTDSGPAT
jgi:excisionase family DNA binding protein